MIDILPRLKCVCFLDTIFVRYKLLYSILSNLTPDGELGWQLHIDNSDMYSIARCDVEYIEQVEALIEIYKDY